MVFRLPGGLALAREARRAPRGGSADAEHRPTPRSPQKLPSVVFSGSRRVDELLPSLAPRRDPLDGATAPSPLRHSEAAAPVGRSLELVSRQRPTHVSMLRHRDMSRCIRSETRIVSAETILRENLTRDFLCLDAGASRHRIVSLRDDSERRFPEKSPLSRDKKPRDTKSSQEDDFDIKNGLGPVFYIFIIKKRAWDPFLIINPGSRSRTGPI